MYSATKLFSTENHDSKVLSAIGFATGAGIAPLALLFGGAATSIGLERMNAPVWDRVVYP